jgi:hypothetical protein
MGGCQLLAVSSLVSVQGQLDRWPALDRQLATGNWQPSVEGYLLLPASLRIPE